MSTPTPHFVRLEYLTPAGWATGHAGVSLLEPQRYVDRLAAKRKFGRAVELGATDMAPTGVVWEPADLPDLKDLKPSDTVIPALMERGINKCSECGEAHKTPWECLL